MRLCTASCKTVNLLILAIQNDIINQVYIRCAKQPCAAASHQPLLHCAILLQISLREGFQSGPWRLLKTSAVCNTIPDATHWLQGSNTAASSLGRSTGSVLRDKTNTSAGQGLHSPNGRQPQPKQPSSSTVHGFAAPRSHQQTAATDGETDGNETVNASTSFDAQRCTITSESMPCAENNSSISAGKSGIGTAGSVQSNAASGGFNSPAKADVSQELHGCMQDSALSGDTAVDSEALECISNTAVASISKEVDSLCSVSPGRRIFAAQVTVTRPRTPASPASAHE